MALENQVTFAEVGNPKRVTQLTENTDAAGAYFLTEKVGETAAKKTSYATVETAVKSKVQSEYLQALSATPASDKTMSEKLTVGELKKRDDKIVQLEQKQNKFGYELFKNVSTKTSTYGLVLFDTGEIFISGQEDYEVIKLKVNKGDIIRYNVKTSTTGAIIAAYNNTVYNKSASIQGVYAMREGLYVVPDNVSEVIISNETKLYNALYAECYCYLDDQFIITSARNAANANARSNTRDALASSTYGAVLFNDGAIIHSLDRDYEIFTASVSPFQKIIYNLKCGNSIAAIACYNNNGDYVRSASLQSSGGIINGEFIVPFGIHSLKITTETSAYRKDYYNTRCDIEKSKKQNINLTDIRISSNYGRNTNEGFELDGGGTSQLATVEYTPQSWDFTMISSFKITSNNTDGAYSYMIGKASNAYAGVISIDNRNKLNIYTSSPISDTAIPDHQYTIPFAIEKNVSYTILAQKNTLKNSKLNVTIISEKGDVYKMPELVEGMPFYGNPFFCSFGKSITSSFSFSINKNDLSSLKLAVWGHSYVEADTLDGNRENSFYGLLQNQIGADRCVNVGFGGDTIKAMLNFRFGFEAAHLKDIKYALLCIGVNDSDISEVMISNLEKIINMCILNEITPILFTVNYRVDAPIPDRFIELNDWIRKSGYKYVDMYKVFHNEDKSIKPDLFLSDNIHPNEKGHRMIYERIIRDCPFLF